MPEFHGIFHCHVGLGEGMMAWYMFFFLYFIFCLSSLCPWIFSAHDVLNLQVFMEDLVPARSHVSLVRSIGSEDPCQSGWTGPLQVNTSWRSGEPGEPWQPMAFCRVFSWGSEGGRCQNSSQRMFSELSTLADSSRWFRFFCGPLDVLKMFLCSPL